MGGSSTDFLFNEDLEEILSLIESDSLAESPESVSMVTKISCEMQNEEPEARSFTEVSKTFKSSRGLQCHFASKQQKKPSAFDCELILKELAQLVKETNIIIELSRDSFF